MLNNHATGVAGSDLNNNYSFSIIGAVADDLDGWFAATVAARWCMAFAM